MKKLLKSEICGFVNSAHHALFTGKIKHFGSQKKKKTEETQNVHLGSAYAPLVSTDQIPKLGDGTLK